MQYIVNATGATITQNLIICQKCGGVDHIMTYCRTHNGKEVQERECTCGNKIRIEMEERHNAGNNCENR